MIRAVVTNGFGNGVFSGSIALVATDGFLSSVPPVVVRFGVTPLQQSFVPGSFAAQQYVPNAEKSGPFVPRGQSSQIST